MSPFAKQSPETDIVTARLANIAVDLGISERQSNAWEIFAETFDAVAQTIGTIEARIATSVADRAPSLAQTLDVQVDELTMRLKAAQILKARTDSLYCTLTHSQRMRANRLLSTICDDLVTSRAPH